MTGGIALGLYQISSPAIRVGAVLLIAVMSLSGDKRPAAAEGKPLLKDMGSGRYLEVDEIRPFFSANTVSRRSKRYGRYKNEFKVDGTLESPTSGNVGKWWVIRTGKLCTLYGGSDRGAGGGTRCYWVWELYKGGFRLIWPNGRGWTYRFE